MITPLDFPSILVLLVGVVGLIVGIIRILSWVNQRKQTRAVASWSTKFEQAVEALTKIYPGSIMTGPSSSASALGVIFPDAEFRGRIERYLGQHNRITGEFESATLSKDQLLNPVIQETIRKALEIVNKFKVEHSDWAKAIKLLPPQ